MYMYIYVNICMYICVFIFMHICIAVRFRGPFCRTFCYQTPCRLHRDGCVVCFEYYCRAHSMLALNSIADGASLIIPAHACFPPKDFVIKHGSLSGWSIAHHSRPYVSSAQGLCHQTRKSEHMGHSHFLYVCMCVRCAQ